ncbi:MAG: helix-turn-helix domain-containing protein [Calditrichaeota bacterium]|nr:MAG: helix-turn-helix domain-containing protein [Calditrichota bacterium]
MVDIGKVLREARKERGKTFEELHEETRIRIEHLEALESNDFSFLPETYVKSFMKTYARAVGLDAEEIAQAYRDNQEEERRELAQQAEDEEETAPEVRDPRPFVEWALGLCSFLLLVSLILVYIEYRSQIYARPIYPVGDRQERVMTTLAELSVENPVVEEMGEQDARMKLEVKALDRVWLRLTIDENKTSEYKLIPEQTRTWVAADRIDITLGQQPTGPNDGKGGKPPAKRVVRLSFERRGASDVKN